MPPLVLISDDQVGRLPICEASNLQVSNYLIVIGKLRVLGVR
jgi:hypothetical protein